MQGGAQSGGAELRAWHCHIWHCTSGTQSAESVPRRSQGAIVASPADLAGPGPLHRAAPGLLWHLQHRRSQDLVLVLQPNPCSCGCAVPAGLGWGTGGSCFYGPVLGNGAGRGCLGWRFTRDGEEVGPLNPALKQTAHRAGDALRKERGQAEEEALF